MIPPESPSSPPGPSRASDAPRRRVPRPVRIALRVVGGIVAVVVAILLLVVVALAIPGVRESLLARGLDVANDALPGELVAESAWPSWHDLRLDHVVWTADGDTLAEIRHLGLGVAVTPLLRKDVVVTKLELEGVRADVPAIQRAMPPAAPDTTRAAGSSGPPPFPRPGSVPGVPSIAVERLVIGVEAVHLDSAMRIEHLRLRAAADLRAGRAPTVRLDTLTVAAPAQDATLRRLTIDADRHALSGSGDVRVAGWPIGIDLSGTIGDREGTLALRARDLEPEPADSAGLDLDLSWRLDGDAVELETDATVWVPSTPRLARDPALSTLGELGRDYAGPEVRVHGRARVGGPLHASAEVTIPPLDWFDGAHLTARVHPDSGTTAHAEATIRDVRLVADADVAGEARSARAELTVRGTRWTEVLPDSLADTIRAQLDSAAVRLTARADDAGDGPALDVALNARVVTPSGTLDSLAVRVDRAGGATSPVRLRLRAGGFGHGVATAATVTGIPGLDAGPGDPIRARLAPIQVVDAVSRDSLGRSTVVGGLEVPGRPTLTVSGDATRIDVDGLRIDGDYGRIDVTGHAELPGRSELALHLAWPEPPLVVLAAAGSDSLRDALRAAWTAGDPTEVVLDAVATRDATSLSAELSGRLALPGPARFAALLPSANLDGLGPITGTLDASVEQAETMRFRAGIDLGETAWIDTFRIEAHGDTGTVAALDTLAIVIDDLAIRGGARVGDRLDGSLALRLAGLELVRRFVPTLEEDARASLALDVALAGTAEAPDVRAQLDAMANLAGVSAPSIEARARLHEGRLANSRVRLGPIDVGATRIDSVAVAYVPRPDGVGLLEGRMQLDVGALELGLHHEMELASLLDERRPGVVDVVTDSLAFRLLDDELQSQGPFRVTVHPDSGLVAIEDLDLRGSLGMIRGAGSSRPEASDLTLEARLTPERPEAFESVAGVWPSALTLRLDDLSDRELSIDLGAEGLSIGSQQDLTLGLRVRGQEGRLDGSLRVAGADSANPVIDLEADLPATWTRIPFSMTRVDSALDVDLSWNMLPLPSRIDPATIAERYLDGEAPDREPRISGQVHLHGSPANPTVEARTALTFHGWSRLERDVLRASARSDGEGVRIEVALVHDSLQVLTLKGRSGPISVAPGSSLLPEGTPIDLSLATDYIDLDRFAPLLPPSMDVAGTLELDATIKGNMPDLATEGTLDLNSVEVSLSDGSQAIASADIEIRGRTTRPELRGEIRIPQAVIRIPEEQPNLLPAEGTAILWDETTFATADSTAADSTGVGRRDVPPAPFVLPEGTALELAIRIPSRFWIRGRGLDVEMAGDLQVKLEDGMPTPVGSLRPVSGRLQLLGRTFRVQEGSVTFYGQDALDPTLDLGLRLELNDVEVRVSVTGTATAPELALSSTPEMPEGDIFSFLLFGERMDDLDSAQMGLLQDRALDVAQSYAAARLEAELGQRLGVDLVQIDDNSGDGEATTLTVGKYLSPKALVKLEQELGGSGESALHLEYQLIKRLFLETFVSRELSSGAEVSWSKNY